MALNITTRAHYALRLMVEITRASLRNESVHLGEISRRTDISRRYLEQIVIPLKGAALIKGRSGKNGGYTLAKPAAEIALGHVIEATIGPIGIVECVEDPQSCIRAPFCECHLIWKLINSKIRDVLYCYSLDDLSDKKCLGEIFAEVASLEEKKTAPKKFKAPSTTEDFGTDSSAAASKAAPCR
jgi:Rrf2 family protein